MFYYFNDEWIAIPIDIVSTDSIQKMEVKDDKYGNRAIFFTISPEYLDQIKAETRKFLINLDPVCEFPEVTANSKEWLDTNIQIPKGYKGNERVIVEFKIQPDGTVTAPKL